MKKWSFCAIAAAAFTTFSVPMTGLAAGGSCNGFGGYNGNCSGQGGLGGGNCLTEGNTGGAADCGGQSGCGSLNDCSGADNGCMAGDKIGRASCRERVY